MIHTIETGTYPNAIAIQLELQQQLGVEANITAGGLSVFWQNGKPFEATPEACAAIQEICGKYGAVFQEGHTCAHDMMLDRLRFPYTEADNESSTASNVQECE
jgi:hypothetical protein